MGDNTIGVLIILGIIFIALFGGIKNPSGGPVNQTQTPAQSQSNIQQQIYTTQNQVDNLKKQLQIEEDKKNQSQYHGMVTLSYINRSDDPNQEYVTISVNYNAPGTIPVTGWVLKSVTSGSQISIPKGTYLYFTGMLNAEEDIYLNAGDILYLVTGTSPIGASFKVNKCSGYLSQFQTFVPYLYTSCPLPRNEDLSSIPRTVINDVCFDTIESLPQCKIQTGSAPLGWSSECINFIFYKINYPSCVNTHKDDKDFYQKEWRVYLKRSGSMWKTRRETVVLYDNVGKVVDTLSY